MEESGDQKHAHTKKKKQQKTDNPHSEHDASTASLCPTIYSPVTPDLHVQKNNGYINAQNEWQLYRPCLDRLIKSSLILVSSVFIDLSYRKLRNLTVDTFIVYATPG